MSLAEKLYKAAIEMPRFTTIGSNRRPILQVEPEDLPGPLPRRRGREQTTTGKQPSRQFPLSVPQPSLGSMVPITGIPSTGIPGIPVKKETKTKQKVKGKGGKGKGQVPSKPKQTVQPTVQPEVVKPTPTEIKKPTIQDLRAQTAHKISTLPRVLEALSAGYQDRAISQEHWMLWADTKKDILSTLDELEAEFQRRWENAPAGFKKRWSALYSSTTRLLHAYRDYINKYGNLWKKDEKEFKLLIRMLENLNQRLKPIIPKTIKKPAPAKEAPEEAALAKIKPGKGLKGKPEKGPKGKSGKGPKGGKKPKLTDIDRALTALNTYFDKGYDNGVDLGAATMLAASSGNRKVAQQYISRMKAKGFSNEMIKTLAYYANYELSSGTYTVPDSPAERSLLAATMRRLGTDPNAAKDLRTLVGAYLLINSTSMRRDLKYQMLKPLLQQIERARVEQNMDHDRFGQIVNTVKEQISTGTYDPWALELSFGAPQPTEKPERPRRTRPKRTRPEQETPKPVAQVPRIAGIPDNFVRQAYYAWQQLNNPYLDDAFKAQVIYGLTTSPHMPKGFTAGDLSWLFQQFDAATYGQQSPAPATTPTPTAR